MEVNKLKEVKRKGWVMDGVKDPESVTDHSWRVALIVMVLGAKRKINMEHALKMALIHDIPEVRVGDIVEIEKIKYNLPGTEPPKEMFDQISKEEKHKIEENTARDMLSDIEGAFEIWKEYQEGKTEEAKFVKQVDKLETVLQALEYESKGNYSSKTLHHYYPYGRENIKDPELLKLLDEIEARRPKS